MIQLESKFLFGKIVIVESIPKNGMKTGKILYKELSDFEKIAQTGILIEYKRISTAKQLIKFLAQLKKDTKTSKKIPILHIEAHGNPSGLELSSGELMSWSLLIEPFTNLNIETQNNLFVVVSACFGAFVMDVIRLSKMRKSPIFALQGPLESIKAGELELGYQAFYRELLETKNLDKSRELLNRVISDKIDKFMFITAQGLFYVACKLTLLQWKSSEHEKNINKLIDNDIRSKDLSPQAKKQLSESILEHNPIDYFKELYDEFMMIDLYQENALRFKFDKAILENILLRS